MDCILTLQWVAMEMVLVRLYPLENRGEWVVPQDSLTVPLVDCFVDV